MGGAVGTGVTVASVSGGAVGAGVAAEPGSGVGRGDVAGRAGGSVISPEFVLSAIRGDGDGLAAGGDLRGAAATTTEETGDATGAAFGSAVTVGEVGADVRTGVGLGVTALFESSPGLASSQTRTLTVIVVRKPTIGRAR